MSKGKELLLAIVVLSCGGRSSLDVFGGPPASNGRGQLADGSPSSGVDADGVDSGPSGSGDSGSQPLSCAAGGAGLSDCGPIRESCCTSLDGSRVITSRRGGSLFLRRRLHF